MGEEKIITDLTATTVVCAHCEKDIPTSNSDIHFAHCSRNFQRCSLCRVMIPIKFAADHYDRNHAPVNCSLCSETVEREVLDIHKGEKCPQRMVTCEYCEFPLPVVDIFEHQEVCGNRTEYCEACNRYVRLRERISHDVRFHSSSNGSAGSSSRSGDPHGREERNNGRRRGQDLSKRSVLLTIAITGIAVLLGSIFLQRRGSDAPQRQ